MGEVIVITSGKGGVGKTTTTANLGSALALKGKKVKLKSSSYKTILELASSGKALGLITREYIDKNDYKELNLVEVDTTIGLGKVEFGIYTNSAKFKELNNLIKLIKDYFN